jgi:hypothetical protein
VMNMYPSLISQTQWLWMVFGFGLICFIKWLCLWDVMLVLCIGECDFGGLRSAPSRQVLRP